jgi:hypothetical protein
MTTKREVRMRAKMEGQAGTPAAEAVPADGAVLRRRAGVAGVGEAMGELARFPAGPVAVRTLAELQADLSAPDRLPLDALVALRRQLRVLAADLEQEVTARLLAGFQGDGGLDAVAVLTPARLAELWSMPAAKIRELCRTGRIPARKLGNKEWVVPVAALREWARQGIVDEPRPGHNAGHVGHRSAVASARPYTIQVRRPAPPEGG